MSKKKEVASEASLSPICRQALTYYKADTRDGKSAYLTDRLKKALASGAVMEVMADLLSNHAALPEKFKYAQAYLDALKELEIHTGLQAAKEEE